MNIYIIIKFSVQESHKNVGHDTTKPHDVYLHFSTSFHLNAHPRLSH